MPEMNTETEYDIFFEVNKPLNGLGTMAHLYNTRKDIQDEYKDYENLFKDLKDGKLSDRIMEEYLKEVFKEMDNGNLRPIVYLSSGAIRLRNKLLVFLDTETTGLYPTDRVIQLSFIIQYGLTEVFRFNEYIKAGKKMSKEARKITGITDEIINKYGRSPEFVYTILECVLSVCDKAIAYNAQFDKRMLIASSNEYCKKELQSIPWICCMNYATLKGHRGKLTVVYKKLIGKDFTGAHDAMNDTVALRDVYNYLTVN